MDDGLQSEEQSHVKDGDAVEEVNYPGVLRMAVGGEEREVLGVVRVHRRGPGRSTVSPITAIRAAAEEKASWPRAVHEREERIWRELVALDRTYRECLQSHGDSGAFVASGQYKRRRYLKNAYSNVCQWKQRQAARVTQAVRRRVIAAWEAQGRPCGICGQVVAEGEDYHVHHVIPVSDGGTGVFENLRTSHARCNLRYGSYAITFALGETEESKPCTVCRKDTMLTLDVTFVGERLATLHLCHRHRRRKYVNLSELLGDRLEPKYHPVSVD